MEVMIWQGTVWQSPPEANDQCKGFCICGKSVGGIDDLTVTPWVCPVEPLF